MNAVEPVLASLPEVTPLEIRLTREGLRAFRYAIPLDRVPADFFADPDGAWSYERLLEAAGFKGATGVAVGALRQPWNGHLDGAAVVTLNAEARPYVAIVECPIAYTYVDASELSESSAA
jgi:hypothetical protein